MKTNLRCNPGRYHYHFLPLAPLSPFQAPPASSHCRSHWRNHTGTIRDDAHPWLRECHLPLDRDAELKLGRQPRAGLVSLPGRSGSQYATLLVQLARGVKCGSCWNDIAFRLGLCYCVGFVQSVP